MTHITFIHGLKNKPEAGELLKAWKRSMQQGGLDLGEQGVTSSMVYWADVLYESPSDIEGYESDDDEGQIKATLPTDNQLTQEVSDFEQKLYENMLEGLLPEYIEGGGEQQEVEELFPRPVTKVLLKTFARDAYLYLYNKTFSPRDGVSYKVQDEIRGRVITALGNIQSQDTHILITHSMGTIIAYDCLKRVKECPKVDYLITLGSPLGLYDIQRELKPEWSKENGFVYEKLRKDWYNYYDSLDVISRPDPTLEDDYKKNGVEVITDYRVKNEKWWTHSATKYLRRKKLIEKLKSII